MTDPYFIYFRADLSWEEKPGVSKTSVSLCRPDRSYKLVLHFLQNLCYYTYYTYCIV